MEKIHSVAQAVFLTLFGDPKPSFSHEMETGFMEKRAACKIQYKTFFSQELADFLKKQLTTMISNKIFKTVLKQL
jgi:hypothetical protein